MLGTSGTSGSFGVVAANGVVRSDDGCVAVLLRTGATRHRGIRDAGSAMW